MISGKSTQIPGLMITRQMDGVAESSISKTPKDTSPSRERIYGTNYTSIYSNGLKQNKAEQTNDKIVIGYTAEGLPFQLVMSANQLQNDKERTAAFNFIDLCVLPLIDDCAIDLSEKHDPRLVIEQLMNDIDELKEKSSVRDLLFSMSLAVTYSKYDKEIRAHELRCAGFSLGQTGLMLHQHNGVVVGLGTKDDPIFTLAVDAGCDLVGHTQLMPGVKFVDSYLSREIDLFDRIKSDNKIKFEKLSNEGQGTIKEMQFGGPCMLGAVRIPNHEFQNQRISEIYDLEKQRFIDSMPVAADSPIPKAGQRVLDAVNKLEPKEMNLPRLTRALATSTRAMQDPTERNLLRLQHQAAKVDTASTKLHRGLTIAMLALGILIIGLGIGLMFTGVGTAAGIGIVAGGAVLAYMLTPLLSWQLGPHIKRGLFGSYGIKRDMNKLADICRSEQLAPLTPSV